MPALPDFSKTRLIVVGDAMLDIYMKGASTRMMPEAETAPVVVIDSTDTGFGGAANVALNAASLGAPVDFICLGGNDAGRETMLDLAKQAGMAIEGFIVDDTRPTTVKERVMNNGVHIARIDREKTHDVSGAVKEALLAHYRQCLGGAQAVILSDYCKGCLPDDLVRELIALATEQGVPVLADSKKQDVGAYAGALCLKPNLKELKERTGMEVSTSDAVEKAARQLMKDSGIYNIIASRSDEGVMLVGEKDIHIYDTTARAVREVSGVGDTLMAATALCVASGMTLSEAVRIGNIAAGAAVEKEGTTALTHEELTTAVLRCEKEANAA